MFLKGRSSFGGVYHSSERPSLGLGGGLGGTVGGAIIITNDACMLTVYGKTPY